MTIIPWAGCWPSKGIPMGSSYRIKDRQITVVNRRMGKQNMTITVLDSDKTPRAGSCRTATW